MRYEYFCDKCEEKKEVEHSMKETPEITCDSCNGKMNKLLTGGMGFIINNDYMGRSLPENKKYPRGSFMK